MRKLPDRKALYALIAVVIAALGGMYIPGRISVTLTPSLDKRVFLLSEATSGMKIKKGDYVMFMLSTHYINNGRPVRTIKRVGCTEGSTLSVKWEKYYYCNNMYIGQAKDKSLKGEPVKSFRFNGEVPNGALFVVGDHPDSYDSKYFGFLRKEDVKAIAHPIF